MFEGIKKLLPGHTLTWINGEVTIKEYWDLRYEIQKSNIKMQNAKFKMQNEKYYAEKIYELLKEAVEERLMSEVPLGAFLSGGIDSSIVVGLMSRIMDQPVKTFSIGYGKEAQAYNELRYSRLVAKHFKTDHREFIVEPKVIELLPELIWHLEEPFADSSAIVTYLVSQVAREHVTVALTGVGGDEVFGGYPRYLGTRFAESYLRIPEFLREKVISKIVNRLPESTKGRHFANRLKRFVRFSPLPPEERYISWVSFFDEQERRRLYSGIYQNTDTMGIHKAFFKKIEATDFLNKVFYVDVKTYLPNDLLFMGDRMSMAHSLELRVPFCDHRLLEFSATIPQEMKIRGWHLKHLLKKSMSELLPSAILKRGKQGFMVPLGMWFQGELRDFTSRILLGSKASERRYFKSDYVKKLLEEHYKGRRDNTHKIWVLLVFVLWHRTFIDSNDFSKPQELDELLRH
jgi:asparagine synthase (glutamine-hydrolysing)